MNPDKYKRLVFSLTASGLCLVALFLLLSGMGQIARADPGDWFVTPGGGGDCSQGSPCNLVTALLTATNGDTIYIAGGTYTGSGGAVITLTQSIVLYGGWDGTAITPPVRNPNMHSTTVDGEGVRRGVYVGDGITVTLEGFTVTNGVVIGNGGGLYARDAALTLREMIFYSNTITDTDYAYGGGAFVEGGTLHVEASTFQANSSWATQAPAGGGLAISHTLTAVVEGGLFQDNDAWLASGLSFLGDAVSHPPFTLRNNTFADNGLGYSPGDAYGGYAGAVQVANAQVRIEGNRMIGNRASNDRGAMGIFSSDLLLARNVITGNLSFRVSGLYLSNVSPFTVTNNIIAANRSTSVVFRSPAVRVSGGGGQFLHNIVARNENASGLQVDSSANVNFTNTILVSHTLGITVEAGSAAALEGTLWGSGSWANDVDWNGAGTIVTGTVNIWGNPTFADPGSGNYHIWLGSAAVDAGVNAGVTEDIDGDPRPVDAGYDIGADELRLRYIYLPLVVKNHP